MVPRCGFRYQFCCKCGITDISHDIRDVLCTLGTGLVLSMIADGDLKVHTLRYSTASASVSSVLADIITLAPFSTN